MTKGVSSKQQHQDRLRLQRQKLAQASGALQGAKDPPQGPTRPGRPSAGRSEPLPAMSYPVKKVSLGDRQSVGPIGRESK